MNYEMPPFRSQFSELSDRVAKTVKALRHWQALEYTGHFIDLHPEQKERIAEVAKLTDEILDYWGCSIKPPPEPEDARGFAATYWTREYERLAQQRDNGTEEAERSGGEKFDKPGN